MSATPKRLHVVFQNAQAFQEEYDSNLSNGGVFVPTDEVFELRQFVEVRLDLAFAGQTLDLEAEIVHVAGSEMVGLGGTAGVAVQFRMGVNELRDRLSQLGQATEGDDRLREEGPRGAPRKAARVLAKIQHGDLTIVGQTRNLSATGALVDVDGTDLVPGSKVTVVLRHPATDSQMAVDAEVVRQVVTAGDVSAVGISFAPDAADRDEVERFVQELQALEHTRRLGGISGPLDGIGAVGVLQMFSTTAPKGTLVLRRGQEEGVIAFESGLLRVARFGASTGMKALVRLLQWEDGVFEFQSHLEEAEISDAPFPLEAAMLDAVRQIDEGARNDAASFPLQAKLRATGTARAPESALEASVLDLAQAGFTVQRALEIVPEPDPEVFRAIAALVDAGALAVEG